MSRQRSKARRLAVQALYQWQFGGDRPADIAAQFRAEREADGADLEYFDELLREVVAGREALDAAIAPFLDRPPQQVDAVERAVLWVGAYELAERLDVPYRVVLNEGIELARTFGGENAHRYVNAVLDRLARQVRAREIALPQRDGR